VDRAADEAWPYIPVHRFLLFDRDAKFGNDVVSSAKEMGSLPLAKESECKGRFPECDIGAMAPFGNLYGMAVYVDESLTKDKNVAFNAGSHDELLQVSYSDFERLVNPKVLRFSMLPDVEALGAWHL